jgi:hypothetical protein
LFAASGSFGLSLLLLDQFRQEQTKDSEPSNAKAATLQQAKVLKSEILDNWEEEAKAKACFLLCQYGLGEQPFMKRD